MQPRIRHGELSIGSRTKWSEPTFGVFLPGRHYNNWPPRFVILPSRPIPDPECSLAGVVMVDELVKVVSRVIRCNFYSVHVLYWAVTTLPNFPDLGKWE